MKTIHWGIIGAGNISSFFATALNGMEDTKLSAVASRNTEKAKEFAEKYGCIKAYGSYEELARDPEIDVIYIGTPHTEHKANAELCIKHGKSVLCEKPFTLNEKDSKYLVNLAKEHKVFLMEAMWTKFLPVTKEVKTWIREGRIGIVKKLQISFGFQAEINEDHRLFNHALAGGALLDVGIYPIAYAIDLLGKLPVKVVSTAVLLPNGIDEQNCILFNFENGVIAALSSAITAEVGQAAIIYGEKGRIEIPDFWKADKAFIYDKDNKLIQQYTEDSRINGYEYEAYEVNECVRKGIPESKIHSLEDTLNIMHIMDEIRGDWGLKYS